MTPNKPQQRQLFWSENDGIGYLTWRDVHTISRPTEDAALRALTAHRNACRLTNGQTTFSDMMWRVYLAELTALQTPRPIYEHSSIVDEIAVSLSRGRFRVRPAQVADILDLIESVCVLRDIMGLAVIPHPPALYARRLKKLMT